MVGSLVQEVTDLMHRSTGMLPDTRDTPLTQSFVLRSSLAHTDVSTLP